MMANHKIQLLYDDWHRIDIIMKGNLQRRVRKAWLNYKHRKEEKKRKKKEAAEAKKGKFGRRAPSKKVSAAPARAAPPKPAATTTSQPSATPSPEKKQVETPAQPQPEVKAVPADPTDPLSQTVVNISLQQTLVGGELDIHKQSTMQDGIK